MLSVGELGLGVLAELFELEDICRGGAGPDSLAQGYGCEQVIGIPYTRTTHRPGPLDLDQAPTTGEPAPAR